MALIMLACAEEDFILGEKTSILFELSSPSFAAHFQTRLS
jgi:hypothetical protein